MSTEVKIFHSAQAGAPTLHAGAGTMIAVLDACLITGWGATTASISVTSGVATATVTSPHPFEKHIVVNITGLAEASLNGDKRVTSHASTTFTFAAPGTLDGNYTGATVKVAPLGWQTVMTATNQRIYKSTHANATTHMLRVDDTNTVSGWNVTQNTVVTSRAATNVSICYEATDINTWTGTGSTFWTKQNSTTSTTARPWVLIGDARGFYIKTECEGTSSSADMYYFGELARPTRINDQSHVLLTGYDRTQGTYGYSAGAYSTNLSNFGNLVTFTGGMRTLARSHSQIGSGVGAHFIGSSASTRMGLGGYTFPVPVDNGLYFGNNIVVVENSVGPRGVLPGALHLLHTRPFLEREAFTNLPGLTGRTVMAIHCNATNTQTTDMGSQLGQAFIDITGPWR